MHARQKLVRRLDNYCREHRTMLLSVMALLQKDFSHIIERQVRHCRAPPPPLGVAHFAPTDA